LLGQQVVDVLGHFRVCCASRALIARNDVVDENTDGLPLVRIQELRCCLLRDRRLRGAHGRLRARGCWSNRRGDRNDAEHLERRSSPDAIWAVVWVPPAPRPASLFPRHMAPACRCFAMYSLVRHDSARIVHVGFLSACETNGAPSATNRFLTSCAWQFALTTDVFGSLPMRAPPSSWIIVPPAARP